MADDTPTPAAETPSEPNGQPTVVSAESMLERSGRWIVSRFANPRLRTALVGFALILIAALIVTHSFWTFPILIVGIVMVVVAWVGSRLEGRIVLEWGELGAGFEVRTRFRSPTQIDHLDELRAVVSAADLRAEEPRTGLTGRRL